MQIKLSTKSFGAKDESAATAARALEAQKHSLVDVDLSDVIAGRDEKEALAALQILSKALGNLNLQRLDLSDNALGEKGLRACSESFSNQVKRLLKLASYKQQKLNHTQILESWYG